MSFTLSLGSKAPLFKLKSVDGTMLSLSDFDNSKYLVVFFTCNHCPYVIGSDEITRQTAMKFKDKDVVFVGINSNSPNTYSEDGFEGMVSRMNEHKFPWIYLHDSTQEIAKLYGALRTPHFFVFNEKRELVYTGRGIDTPRDYSKMTINDLDRTLDELTSGKPIAIPLTNPIGCNVKWDGKDPHWMPADACDLV